MPQSEYLPDEGGDDDNLLNRYRNPQLQPEAQASFIDELLQIVRQANAPRPLVILEREQADFLRNLMLDLVAGNETARYAIDRLRIGLDLLDGRTRE
ncbi:hypothetical protein ACKFKG_05755 [Phormidesmis sp. 146-35]